MSDEVKKSDTELAVEFIERGQNALGQANVMILVRPEKLIEKIEKEIEKVRGRIRELQGQIGQIPTIDKAIMDKITWQSESGGQLSAKEYLLAENKKKYDSLLRDHENIKSYHERNKLSAGYYTPQLRDCVYDRMKEAFDSAERSDLEESNGNINRSLTEYQKIQSEVEVARKEYERRKNDSKYYDEYVAERQKAIAEAEVSRNIQVAILNAEIEKQEKRIEKFQEYILLLIEKAIGST